MPRIRKPIRKDEKRQMYYGRFYDLQGDHPRAPRYKLCSFDAYETKITSKGECSRFKIEKRRLLERRYAAILR